MFKTLSPGTIDVNPPDLNAAIQAARMGGFEGLEFRALVIADLIDRIGVDAIRKSFADAHIKPAGWGLPVQWRQGEEKWRDDLKNLARCAKAASALGTDRCFTWVLPASNERDFEANWKFHRDRFGPIAQTLAEFGQRLGLEFIGPKTSRDGAKFPFIWTLRDMLRLAREIGPNVGLLVDCWHWYTSHGTLDELKSLRPDEVVYVHVNDAPRGIDIDQQIDGTRCLPGETGVIDIAGFLKSLQQIGYDGPVTPEPFKRGLKDLPSDEARLKAAVEAMDKIWRQAGL